MIIFCDGSCRKNGYKDSEGGYGVIICDNKGNLINCYQHAETATTNNQQELKAILFALIHYGKLDDIIIFSDSAYCVNALNSWIYKWANNGWKKANNQIIENLELFQTYYKLFRKGYTATIKKVKGHNNILGNELADKLATQELTTENILKTYKNKQIISQEEFIQLTC